MSARDLSRIEFGAGQLEQWAGMGDFLLVSPSGEHQIELVYAGEPPHGDSYHLVKIDGRDFPGLAWGCMFAMSACSRYLAMSWMRERFERLTVVVDMDERKYVPLPSYMYQLRIEWPSVVGATGEYTFDGTEEWLPY